MLQWGLGVFCYPSESGTLVDVQVGTLFAPASFSPLKQVYLFTSITAHRSLVELGILLGIKVSFCLTSSGDAPAERSDLMLSSNSGIKPQTHYGPSAERMKDNQRHDAVWTSFPSGISPTCKNTSCKL